jgi:4-amino-4-deoxy-L-arabinose transferase-like glycosyltransferase
MLFSATSLDKAPLAPWLQATSAKLFGFHGLSLLLPQSFAGILAVALLYRLVRRSYGNWAGLLAALTLAVTPISVVTNRNNTPDALLILTLLLATWSMFRATENGSLGWLLVSAALVGVAFNIKMLQILLVLPAFAVLYLFTSPLSWKKRLGYAAVAVLVGICVSSPWVLAVELTSPNQRPYIGGSVTNSVVELIFNYNGVARLWGEDWSYWLGAPGPLRFFNDKLAGQIAWLLPFATLGLVVAVRERKRAVSDTQRLRRRQALILWSSWLAFQLVYFSSSSFYHRYYLATMAPGVAALVGIGAHALWTWWRSPQPRKWMIAIILIANAGIQALILRAYPAWRPRLVPVILGLCLITIGMSVAARRARQHAQRWSRAAFAIGCLTLLLAPTVWTLIPVLTCTNPVMPTGGPQASECVPFEAHALLDPELVAYLESNRQGARYLAATYDLGISAFGILETGEPFMSLGGYRGTDPILSVEEFAQLVAGGEVRFFLNLADQPELPEQGMIKQWVTEHCPLAPVQPDGIEVRGPCVTA